MRSADLTALGDAVILAVRGYVARAHASNAARLDDFEDRLKALPKPERGEKGDAGERGDAGKDAEPIDIARVIAEVVGLMPKPERGEKGESGDRGNDGKDADAAAITVDVLEQVTIALEKIPVPKDGADGACGEPGTDGAKGDTGERGMNVYEVVCANGYKGTAAEWCASLQGKDGKDGKDSDPARVEEFIETQIREAVDAIPKPNDGEPGRDGVSEDQVAAMVLRMVATHVSEAVTPAVAKAFEAIRPPKDGEPGRDALQIDVLDGIDESKSYLRGTCATHRGGTIRAYRATDPVGDSLEKAGWHVVFNGVAEEQETTTDDGRTVERVTVYTNGKRFVRQHIFSVVIDRGVFHEGQAYQKGDGVTWARHYWIAQTDTESKPEPGSDWRLAVKSGRDGRDGKDKGTT